MPNDRKMDQHLNIESHGDLGITLRTLYNFIYIYITQKWDMPFLTLQLVIFFHFRWFGLAV